MTTITDTQAAELLAGLTAPRITLEYMESRIRTTEFINPDSAPTTTLCLIVLDNGFSSVGLSAPAAYQNFDPQLGQKYARENALRDLWGKFGFALAEKIHANRVGEPLAGLVKAIQIKYEDRPYSEELAKECEAELNAILAPSNDVPVATPTNGNTGQDVPAVSSPSAATLNLTKQ